MKLAVMKEPSPANNGESAPLDTGPGWRIGVSAIRAHRALGTPFSVLLCSIVSGGPNTELRQMVLPSFYR